MTLQELKLLSIGTRVQWEGSNDQGVIAFGPVTLWRGVSEPTLHIQWDDRQVTHSTDDAALEYVAVVRTEERRGEMTCALT